MDDGAQDRIMAVYGPFSARLGEPFADCTPDEIALADWFTKARAAMHAFFDELRGSAWE